MKNLATVSASVYHKHYVDNAFAKAHEADHLENTHIITYTHYSKLQSAGYFLNRNFFRKSKNPKVIIGIGGLGDNLEKEKLESQLTALIKYLPNHVSLYVHAACHVKMLSYNSTTILGSQNISSTSMPYFSAAASQTYRHHEVQVEFQDNSLLCAKKLFSEVLCDPNLAILINRKSLASDVVSHLVTGFSLERHKQDIAFTQNLTKLMNSATQLPCKIELTPEPENNHQLVSLAIRLYQAKNITRTHINDLFEALYMNSDDHALGEDLSDCAFELSQLLEASDEKLIPEKNFLTPLLTSIYSREMVLDELCGLPTFIDTLKEIIEQHCVTSIDDFITEHQHHLVQRIMENPDYSQNPINLSRDSDGYLDEAAIMDALLDGVIDTTRYQNTLNLSAFTLAVHEAIDSHYITTASQIFEIIRDRQTKLFKIYERELLSAT